MFTLVIDLQSYSTFLDQHLNIFLRNTIPRQSASKKQLKSRKGTKK